MKVLMSEAISVMLTLIPFVIASVGVSTVKLPWESTRINEDNVASIVANLQNWCSLGNAASISFEGFNLTKKFADDFRDGLQEGPQLKVLVAEALAETDVTLNIFQEILLDLIESWIKRDLVDDLIQELIEVEAEIMVSLNTGIAICQALLDQANNLINQLIELGECCILSDACFWEQVLQAACELLNGSGKLLEFTTGGLDTISEENLKPFLENLVMNFEKIILAAAEYHAAELLQEPASSDSGGNFPAHAVRQAVVTWSKATVNAGFSPAATQSLNELIQHFSEGSELSLDHIGASTTSLMDWALESSCSVPDGHGHLDIIVNVTDEFDITATQHHITGSTDGRKLWGNPPPIPPFICTNLLQQISPCSKRQPGIVNTEGLDMSDMLLSTGLTGLADTMDHLKDQYGYLVEEKTSILKPDCGTP